MEKYFLFICRIIYSAGMGVATAGGQVSPAGVVLAFTVLPMLGPDAPRGLGSECPGTSMEEHAGHGLKGSDVLRRPASSDLQMHGPHEEMSA